MASIYKTENGSAILIVVLVMSVLLLCCIGFWHSSALLQNISIKVLEYEQKYSATQGALNCAISFCAENFDQLIEEGEKNHEIFDIGIDKWLISKSVEYSCRIYIQPNNQSIALTSVLCDFSELKSKKIFEISCNMQKLKHSINGKKYYIQNWSVSEK